MPALDDFRSRYQTSSDEELCILAQDHEALTSEAFTALQAELQTRGLTDVRLRKLGSEIQQAEKDASLSAVREKKISVYGFGLSFMGKDNLSRTGDSEEYTSTLWFRVFWMPLIPLSTFRLRRRFSDVSGPKAIARLPRDWSQIGITFALAIAILLLSYSALRILAKFVYGLR